jgi:hypothetical protein
MPFALDRSTSHAEDENAPPTLAGSVGTVMLTGLSIRQEA